MRRLGEQQRPIDGVVSTGTANSTAAIDHFALTFNQPLEPMSAGAANSYSLTSNTGITYVLSPSYAAGSLTVNFTMTPEPLQPGSYTFNTLSALIDQTATRSCPSRYRSRSATRRMGRSPDTTHQTRFVPGATPLPMTQVSAGFLTRWAWAPSPAPVM